MNSKYIKVSKSETYFSLRIIITIWIDEWHDVELVIFEQLGNSGVSPFEVGDKLNTINMKYLFISVRTT